MNVEPSSNALINELWLTLIVTIISSIITWSFLLMVQRVVLPWYENLTYKGIRLEGSWQSTTSSHKKVTHHEFMDIKQRGHILTGYYFVKNELKKSKPILSNYSLEGRIVNNHISLSCFIKSQKRMGIVQFLLEIDEGGEALTGKALWINRAEKDIMVTDDYNLQRVK